MKYSLMYLTAGVVTLLITIAQSRIDTKKHGKPLGDQLTELKLQSASASKQFVHKVVVPVTAGVLVILVWPVALFMVIKGAFTGRQEKQTTASDRFTVSEQDLLEKLTIDEVEEREMVHDPLGAVPNEPFGHLSPAWQRFKVNLQQGDRLWSFESSYDSAWQTVETRSGYVISRGSRLGPYILTCREVKADYYVEQVSR